LNFENFRFFCHHFHHLCFSKHQLTQVHLLAATPATSRSTVFRSGLLAGLRDAVKKSDVSQVYSCIISTCPVGSRIVLCSGVAGLWGPWFNINLGALPFPPLHFPSPPPVPPVPQPSPCHEATPKSSYRAWGSAVSSPSGVWGGAPVEIEFGAFYP